MGPLIVDIAGISLNDSDKTLLLKPCVSGLILFSRNFESPAQLKSLMDQVRQLRSELVVYVDQEGGRVQRFKDGFTRLPPAQSYGNICDFAPEEGLSLAKDAGWLMASELLSFGVDVSFAPVLDVANPQSKVIGDRGFAIQPERIAEIAGAFIEGMAEAGMKSCGKHFPGHGSVTEDSHHELPVDSRNKDQIFQHDLLPFQQLISQQKLDSIMPAHVVYSDCDDQPAGFSKFWVQQTLKQQFGFNGLVFSDDLTMAGAHAAGNICQRADAALIAGCDLLLVCNNRDEALEVADHLQNNGFDQVPAEKLAGKLSDPDFATSKRYKETACKLNALSAA
ncbi:beta-N-acetylhexosaminidase [Pelagibaculum spongiae]|uniref:Beta-hexosaminidase n=1 Tax=Pelagibaculum spongiae TaxID=2080658 RepID=A0A2V1GTE9_9GAMM|nr:beta-N-acetylhexosaminidase [Pelagibaculum spongiae]PVZ68878.1 beta-N-acetylhexosaminidase [Pelagibaculum spongiae]